MPTKAAAVLIGRLEAQRHRMGLSQAAFARLIGVAPSNYSKFKSGELELNPLLETLEQWSDRLRVSIGYLVSDEEPKLSPEKQSALEAGEKFLALAADTIRNSRTRR